MKLTYWEISIINQSVGIAGGVNVQKLESALSLREKLNSTDYVKIVKTYFSKKDKKEEVEIDIFKKGEEIDLSKSETDFALEAISNPNLNLPILPESLDLVKKLKDA